MPYNPATQAGNPYTLNARELPSNPAAAARVPLWNTIDPSTGVAYTGASAWASSPQAMAAGGVGAWGSMNVPPNVTTTPVPNLTSPVSTASVGWPDAIVADRQLTKVPTPTGVSPNPAVHATANAITITGYGFTGATAVTVGGVACTGVTVVNDATITCTTAATGALANAGTYPVAITTPAGVGTGISLTLT